MTVYRSMGARPDATRGTTALEVRKGLASMFDQAGVLPGSASPLVVGTGAFSYQVNAGSWVTSRGPSDGMHLWGNDGAITLTTDDAGATLVAPGSGLQRYDLIYAVHPSSTENGATDSVPLVAVKKGTAAASASVPTLPTGALELARNLMTSAATSTSSAGNTITQTAPVASFVGVGAASGRVAVTMSGGSPVLVGADAAITGTITVPALPVPYRVTIVASGQSGNAASSRNVAWGFDSFPGSATVTQDNPIGNYARVPVAGGVFTTVVANAYVECPANVPCTFRLVYRGDNNGFNVGSLIWRRERV